MKKEKVVFYFPWKEVSGGPYYLTRLADELANDNQYEVYYTDYENGLSDDLLKNESVNKIQVDEGKFSIDIEEPITIITPIYWAHWIPPLHKDSKILFLNWHVCCLPVLKDSWGVGKQDLHSFLKVVRDSQSVFFCDYSHWMGQNTKDIVFEKSYVPISLPEKKVRAKKELVNSSEINIAVLGRLCTDKIYSVTNLLDNLSRIRTPLKKRVLVVGEGPDKDIIKTEKYPDIEIEFRGTVTGSDLDNLLANEVDALFAMGTSILEGAALGLPSIVIPHNMKPMSCNSFVYLQDSRDYCLGWLDTQIDELKLEDHPLSKIIDDIYSDGLKEKLGNSSYQYYLENHTIGAAVKPLKKSLETTRLSYGGLKLLSAPFFKAYKELKKKGVSLVRFDRNDTGVHRFLVFGLPLLKFRYTPNPGERVVYLLGLPILKVYGSLRRPRLRPYFPKFGYTPHEINAVVSASVAEHVGGLHDRVKKLEGLEDVVEQKVNHIDQRINEAQDSLNLAINKNVLELDPCNKILPEESYQYFTGDIREDYLSLIRGLDDQSVEVVGRILARIHQYRNDSTKYFWFTEFERQELRKIHDKHASSILKLADNCYAYGRYLLPRRIISTTIFFYEHFLGHIDDLAKVKEGEIIDVGGFIGDSLPILAKYTDKNVHLFEPISKMFELCEDTVRLNKLENVTLNKMALGAAPGTSVINLAGDASTMLNTDLFNKETCKQEEIKVGTLDEYVEKNNLKVSLIKVDVEGFEQEFLRGAEQTIKTQKPAMLLSIYHNAQDFFKIKPMIESWNLGYKFRVAKPSDQTIMIDTTLICEVRD